MKIKPITFLTLLLGGVALCFTVPFSTTVENDPWARYFACYDQCISGDVRTECQEVCNSEGWETFLNLYINPAYVERHGIRKLRTSTGSHMEPDKVFYLPHPIMQLPNDKPIDVLTAIEVTPELQPYMVYGQLKNVSISIDFLNSKGKRIAKIGQQPMKSAAFYYKNLGVTQKFGKRTNFKTLKKGEVAYFLGNPNFGKFTVKGIQNGTMLVRISVTDKFGKMQIISKTKTKVQYADPDNFKQLMQKMK